MKINKTLIKFAVFLVCLLSLTFSANAQKRKAPVRKAKTTASTPVAPPVNSEVKEGAEKVSIQIKNVSKFIYILGGIAQGIEDIDKDVKSGRASRTTADQNAKNKQTVISTISNLRAGLVGLELEFRTKQSLRNYSFQIQGISDMTATAEDQATAGQLREAGKTLLLVIEKLSDTLVALP
jgi:hypothetical protein